jgi:hypothetical protein
MTAMLAWIVLQVPLALVPVPTPPTCQLDVLSPAALEERVVHDFDRRIDQYVRLHRRLERGLPPEHVFGDFEDMSEAVDALHAALVDARPNATAGMFFTPAVADLLSARLAQAIVKSGHTPAQAWIAMNLGYVSGIPEPQINGRFPATRYVRVWPALLAALPALPEELEYRFVGWDLVLVDVHADLVVDILKNALPAPGADLVRDSAPLRNSPQPQWRDGV